MSRPAGASLRAITGTVRDVFQSLRQHRLGWALPIALVLLTLAGILALLALVPAIAPFIYPVL